MPGFVPPAGSNFINHEGQEEHEGNRGRYGRKAAWNGNSLKKEIRYQDYLREHRALCGLPAFSNRPNEASLGGHDSDGGRL
jgi:hypothetical protein